MFAREQIAPGRLEAGEHMAADCEPERERGTSPVVRARVFPIERAEKPDEAARSLAQDAEQASAVTVEDSPRKRILVCCHCVSPYGGSEPGIGWNVCRRLALYHDVVVLTCPLALGKPNWDFRKEITEYLGQHGPIPGLTFQFVDNPLLTRCFQRHVFPFQQTTYYLGYAAWQRAAFREAVKLHRDKPFDLVHQLTICTYRAPGYLWKLGIPFVWGPISGASNAPWPYFGQFDWRDKVIYGARNIVNYLQLKFARRPRQVARTAEVVWAATPELMTLLETAECRRAVFILDTGTEKRPDAAVHTYNGKRSLRLCWSGSLIGRKALPILLKAIARIRSEVNVELDVLGSGPAETLWQSMAMTLGINSLIRWKGQLPHDCAVREMGKSDAFVLTSLHEATSTVIPEALSLGLPVICHDVCGMAVAVTPECGIKVPLVDPETSIRGFSEAILKLSRSRELERLSAGALKRSEELSWDSKVQEMAHSIREVFQSRAG